LSSGHSFGARRLRVTTSLAATSQSHCAMQAMMQLALFLVFLLRTTSAAFDVQRGEIDHDHHRGHHHHHHRHSHANNVSTKVSTINNSVALKPSLPNRENTSVQLPQHSEEQIVDKMKKLEVRLDKKGKDTAVRQGHIFVNGPLPANFDERFVEAVGKATGADSRSIHVTSETAVTEAKGVVELAFQALPQVVEAVETQAADPSSKLAKGTLHSFLMDRSSGDVREQATSTRDQPPSADEPSGEVAAVSSEAGIDIDTAMPYGDLEPFGREDTAQELTESSVRESDEMVDQLERAEVAEEKRSVFRALTRLRGAAITSFDGVARSQTGNIDEYNKIHKWRNTHPLHHLADEESDISKWAFPDNADF